MDLFHSDRFFELTLQSTDFSQFSIFRFLRILCLKFEVSVITFSIYYYFLGYKKLTARSVLLFSLSLINL